MKTLLVLVQRCVLFPLSFLVPRRQAVWVFGAPQDSFSGNPKYLYLWVSEHRPDIRAVWLTGSAQVRQSLRSRGYRCQLRWSPAGVRAAATARYHFVANDGSDTSFAFTGGAQVFNLWHGVGIKNILRGARIGANARLFAQRWRPDAYLRSMHRFRRPALVLSTSPSMTAHFSRSFGVPPDRCPELGYPRLDPLVDPAFRRLCLSFGDYPALQAAWGDRTVYLYAPTLRDDDEDMLADALPDLDRLSEALRPTNGLLLLKLHPFSLARVAEQVLAYDNIVAWPGELDLYPVLDSIDCLITDYSSLLYDYISTAGSGVVVYAYDYERYVAESRDLALPFEQNVLGARADTFDELCALLRTGAALAELPGADLAVLRERFWGSPQPRTSLACRAICDFLDQQDS